MPANEQAASCGTFPNRLPYRTSVPFGCPRLVISPRDGSPPTDPHRNSPLRGLRTMTEHEPGPATSAAHTHVTIYINTEPTPWPAGEEISFTQVVNIEFDNNPPSGPNVVITVTYTHGQGGKQGSLLPGHSVHVAERMAFDVRATDKS